MEYDELLRENENCEPFWNGWFARKNGMVACHNPYNLQTQNYSFIQWEHGWLSRFELEVWGNRFVNK
jgi:hypothetical protein